MYLYIFKIYRHIYTSQIISGICSDDRKGIFGVLGKNQKMCKCTLIV